MKRKKIYIACPANFATGGPELLHQLCHKLNTFGYEAYMYYYNAKKNLNPIHERFIKYNTEFVKEIEDCADNILIVPEVVINLLKHYKNVRKIIWWLSVDNYFLPKDSIKYKLKSVFGVRDFNYKDENVIHLAQSHYAIDFLKNEKISSERIFYLSDYLNNTFIKNSIKNIKKDKMDYILYNPKKGYEFTKKIIEKAPNLMWKKIENMTPEQVVDLMSKSKVYIDFGNHPGKDRIPREAAINGCCVITGVRGSARFQEDVPLDSDFKFEDSEENIEKIINKIYLLLNNYDEEQKRFDYYRSIIMKEEDLFEKDVKLIFSQL